MGLREKKIGNNFNKMSIFSIVVLALITTSYALDLLFHLGWGYTVFDLQVGLLILTFAIALRFVGLRIIRFFDKNY
jgi:hypothetical protein